MREHGIWDRDTLLVDRAIRPAHGHIVVAVLDNEFTCKYLYKRSGVVKLKAGNPKVGVGLPLVHMLITGFFGFVFVLGFLANVWDGMYTRGGAGLNFMGAMFFAALAFFSLRAFLRSLRVFRDGAKVRSLPGAVLL